ncbi:MAG: hypothetical protein ACLUD2_17140 [Clostridium sp.]
MLAISRGLMMDPDIVMLDEPSLGLAPIIVEGIFDLILQIRDMGKTILLIEAECVHGAFHRRPRLCAGNRKDHYGRQG